MDEIDKAFPFPEYRKYQKETIEKIWSALNDGKDVILSAPTGAGKSPICLTVAKLMGSAYYLTPLKTLQDQLYTDFRNDMAFLKGRNNYRCKARPEYTSDTAPCVYGLCPIELKEKTKHLCDNCDIECPCRVCDYIKAKEKAISSAITCTNLAMFILARYLTRRKLIVIDEAQNIEDFVIPVSYTHLTLPTKA